MTTPRSDHPWRRSPLFDPVPGMTGTDEALPPPRTPTGTLFVGCDPGAAGGVAYLRPDDVVGLAKMPATDRDLLDFLRSLRTDSWEPFAYVERVGGYYSTGGGEEQGGQPGSAMFKFGAQFGRLKMALVAAEIPFEEVQPAAWQKGVGLPPRRKGEAKIEWKHRIKSHAQQLFPKLSSITLSTCDALLIAEWCRRKREGAIGVR